MWPAKLPQSVVAGVAPVQCRIFADIHNNFRTFYDKSLKDRRLDYANEGRFHELFKAILCDGLNFECEN